MFPGSYESKVSKTIRSLLLTSRATRAACLSRLHGIPVPAVGRDCIVRFNPEHHIICIDKVTFLSNIYQRGVNDPVVEVWAGNDADLWSGLNFDIRHLALMWNHSGTYRTVATLCFIFPGLEHIYSATMVQPRPNPHRPLEVVFPDRQPPSPMVDAVFVYMARRYWMLSGVTLATEDNSTRRYRDRFTDTIRRATVKGLVLV